MVRIINDPLCDKVSEVFLARCLDIHQSRKAVWLILLCGDMDRSDKHWVRKFVSNPLHAGKRCSIWDPDTFRVVIKCHAGWITYVAKNKEGWHLTKISPQISRKKYQANGLRCHDVIFVFITYIYWSKLNLFSFFICLTDFEFIYGLPSLSWCYTGRFTTTIFSATQRCNVRTML